MSERVFSAAEVVKKRKIPRDRPKINVFYFKDRIFVIGPVKFAGSHACEYARYRDILLFRIGFGIQMPSILS